MTRLLSPLAAKELIPPATHGDELRMAGVTVVGLAAALTVAWTVSEPVLLGVRHAPLAVAALVTLPQAFSMLNRAHAVAAERRGGTYETLVLGGAGGWRYVLGMTQAGIAASLISVSLELPVFAACAAALGTPLATIGAFLAAFGAFVVLANACAVLAGSGAAPGARGSRPAGAAAGPASFPGWHAMLLPACGVMLLVPSVLIAIRGVPDWGAYLGDARLLPLLFCPVSVFALKSVRLFGAELPWLPLSMAAMLGAATVAMARAAELHRHRRHDRTRVRRALTLGAHALSLLVLAGALWETPGRAALVLVTIFELAWLLAAAPDATSPTWPGVGPRETPGDATLADLFRERCGTGAAFVLVLALSSAPAFALVSPPGMLRVGALAWLYVTVIGTSWALASFAPPAPEPDPADRAGLRTAVALLCAIACATALWDETVLVKQVPWLVTPLRALLGLVLLSTPLAGLVGIFGALGALPSYRSIGMGNPAIMLHTTADGLFWLSLAWHAALAVAAWLRKRRLVRNTPR